MSWCLNKRGATHHVNDCPTSNICLEARLSTPLICTPSLFFTRCCDLESHAIVSAHTVHTPPHVFTVDSTLTMQRTRNVGYDDDDLYDDDYYEEEEEVMSADDKEQMRISTVSVREALGEAGANISDAQIQEALWHYYYDVGKSVSFLKNKFVAAAPKNEPQPKKEKAASRFDQAASAAVEKAPVPAGKQSYAQYSYAESPYPVAPSLPLPPTTMPSTAQDFFADVPWGHVPAHRLGVITIDEPHFRGGLRGGSSKLAALAAKRRREREEVQAASNASGETDAAVAMLDKLTVKSKEGAAQADGLDRPSRISKYTGRKRSPSPKPEAPVEDRATEPEAPKPAIEVEHPAQRATASMFASTLCGTTRSAQPLTTLQEFPAPYNNYKDYQNTRPFEGPSPDDIVRAAQANKGAGVARR